MPAIDKQKQDAAGQSRQRANIVHHFFEVMSWWLVDNDTPTVWLLPINMLSLL